MIFPPIIGSGCALPAFYASSLACRRTVRAVVLANLPCVGVESGVMMAEGTGPRPQGPCPRLSRSC
jgi:hydroxyethylthiazole kinase-like sugar kinase family protein